MANYFEKRIVSPDYMDYESFAVSNRKKVNKYLNAILWYCILTGPAIALGIKAGVFGAVDYFTCFLISLTMYILAMAHFFVIKRKPDSYYSALIAFLAMDLLLMRMELGHIHVNITWFFVPLVSMLFCERRIFLISVVTNYIALIVSIWLISPYYADIGLNYATPMSYFLNAILGYTIETAVMILVGQTLTAISESYIRSLIERNMEMKDQMEQTGKQMDILNSMAGIYDYANLLDFRNMTETALIGSTLESNKIDIEKHAHTRMNHMLKRKVVKEDFDAFQEFTNIRTIRERLTGKKSVYQEFVSVEDGWFRAQYISSEADEDGVPYLIVYTIQNIDEEKHREEQLIRISITDELTRLYNRRCFEEDIAKYENQELEEDFVVASIDLNRLKYANDTKGHAAGDELIIGAAECLEAAIYNSGKVYRTGGDEFTAIIHTDDISEIYDEIQARASVWKGEFMDSLAMSIGFASHKQYPHADIKELTKLADTMMYEEKNRYYKENGLERRGQARFSDAGT